MTALAYTYLLMAMPRTSGDYVYISRTINPLLGFVLSWGTGSRPPLPSGP